MVEFNFKDPDYLPVIKKRIDRLNKIRANKKLLEASKVYYKENPAQFISDWMFTYDPRKTPSTIPFLLWKKQQEYINWLFGRYRNKEDGLVEKSRDAGATYLNMAFALWLWLFHDGSNVSFGSRKEALVDKIGDPDSIFEKGRMILRSLPAEYLPVGYSEKNYTAFLKFINPENGSSITGEAGDNIGRGGRSGLYFKDESAFYEHPELIDAALSQNSDVKIDVSTPNGNGNPFYKKRHGGKIPVFIFDWRDDPRKDDEWYQKQRDTLEDWILAQEVDRDYNASVMDICIPAIYVSAAVEFVKRYSIPTMGARIAGLDVADEPGADKNALAIRRGIDVFYLSSWNGINTTKTSRKAVHVCNENLVDMINYDCIGVGAGVRGEMDSLKEKITYEDRFFPVVNGVNVGSTELLGEYEGRPEKEMFANQRIARWWRIRRRFEKTYEYINNIKKWPIDELISIPNSPTLISQLSQPLRFVNESGKIQLESKRDMRKRGVSSPDEAEAVIYSFDCPEMIPIDKRASEAKEIPAQVHDIVTGKSKGLPSDILSGKPDNKYIDFGEA